MRLSEIKGTNAIDVIADIIDPVTKMLADEEIKKVIKSKKPALEITRTILKRQKEAILEVLAIINRENPKTFKPSVIELPIMIIHLVQDVMDNEELMSLFQSQEQMTGGVSSIPVTDTTQGTETM